MKAEIKRFHSPDVDDLPNFKPEREDSFSFLLQIIAAPVGVDGEESFDVQVCTPKWLSENMKAKEIVAGRHFLFVQYYDYNVIINKIREYVNACDGTDWVEVATKLSRLGRWEFEDYQEWLPQRVDRD